MITVALVDDHDLFRMGVRLALSKNPDIDILGEANSATMFFDMMEQLPVKPQIAIVDIILPDISGIEIARRLQKEYPEVMIFMLSAEVNERVIMELMEIGIDGFISKSAPIGDLLTAIESLADGVPYYGKDIARLMRDVRNSIQLHHVDFSDREKEIIRLCCEGYLGKEIANKMCISPRTVDSHKTNIFNKLGIHNTIELVKYAIRNGIVSL